MNLLTTLKGSDRCFSAVQQLMSLADVALNGSHPWDIQVKHPNFYRRILQQGVMGFGESYMEGWWDCERLDQLFTLLVRARLDTKVSHHLSILIHILWGQLTNLQSRKRATMVGKKHYDLGNDLFTLMLDPYMQYSCGYWKTASTLEQAQEDKLDLICRKLCLKPGMSLLDIGCGWGGLAEYAAQHYQVSVVGITISKEQQTLALKCCQRLDVDIRLQDYRDLNQQFDRIVSVGMFEHVGPKNYRTFFKCARRSLKTEGLFLLHTIGSLTSTRSLNPWIEKYIFPNGCLPSMVQITKQTEGLWVMEDWHNFGADYDLTLTEWERRLSARWTQVEQNYSPMFYRMLRYYLLSCAGRFRARDLQLWQILFSPEGVKGGTRVAR